MDGFTEKKWFVYVGDHHEGPFSLEDIQGKIGAGVVSTTSFVWAEGMADWKGMTEVPDFESVLSASKPSTLELKEAIPEVQPIIVAHPVEPAPESLVSEDSDTDPQMELPSPATKRKVSSRFIKRMAALIILGGLGSALRQRNSRPYPSNTGNRSRDPNGL